MTEAADQRSPEEIERDIEGTRAEMAGTTDAIARRLSPGQLLDQALGYFRAGGTAPAAGEVINRNPLPVALVGIGLVWLAVSEWSRRPGYRTDVGDERRGRLAYGDAVMIASREHLVAWLRDAHAMEQQAIDMLEGMAGRLEHYPELRARIRRHLDETRRQAERVERCLELLGTDRSSLKDIGGKLVGTGQALSGLFASDEVVKGGIAGHAFEHYEIASYRVLIAAAEEAGEPEVARVCTENLREEEAMAAWLADHLPAVTRQYLQRAAAGETAKR